MLRQVAGEQVVVPVGKAVSAFTGMITLNDTGAFLWELLETNQTVEGLVSAVTEKYEIDGQTAKEDVQRFLDKLSSVGAVV